MSADETIYQLIPKVMADIGGVAKTRKNEQQHYKFRGIEDFYLAAHPALITHGVFCAPTVLEREEYRFEKTNEQGRVTTWLHVALKVEHKFYGPLGDSISVTTWGEGLDNSDKATNKAMSGAMKYALIELFCVPTQDVEDSDRTTLENGTKRAPVASIEKPVTFTKSPEREFPRVLDAWQEAYLGKAQPNAIPAPSEILRQQKSAPANWGQDEQRPREGELSSEGVEPPKGQEAASSASGAASPPVEYITTGQARNFHKECRAAVRPARSMEADDLIYKWLADNGYSNEKGEPTASMIPAGGWIATRSKAITWLRSQ